MLVTHVTVVLGIPEFAHISRRFRDVIYYSVEFMHFLVVKIGLITVKDISFRVLVGR